MATRSVHFDVGEMARTRFESGHSVHIVAVAELDLRGRSVAETIEAVQVEGWTLQFLSTAFDETRHERLILVFCRNEQRC